MTASCNTEARRALLRSRRQSTLSIYAKLVCFSLLSVSAFVLTILENKNTRLGNAPLVQPDPGVWVEIEPLG